VTGVGLVRATLAAARLLDDAHVVAVPLPSHGDPTVDHELGQRVAANFAPGEVLAVTGAGDLPDEVADVVAHDQPEERGVVVFFTGLSGSGKSTLAQALNENLFHLDLGYFHSALQGTKPSDFLPARPEAEVYLRHTLGLALGFGRSGPEAAFRVRASLQTPLDRQMDEYAIGWRAWQAQLRSLDRKVGGHNVYRVSTAVLRCHESPTFPGGLIASLSIPWGSSKGDDDLGGYHLVWPRDLAQTAGAFLACGAFDEVLRVMRYLRAIQEEDGSWPQNCWLDGTPYWHGVQLDECAFPMLLLDMGWREGAIQRPVLPAYWPMVSRAAGFVISHGPRTGQDRWEENAGYTPFTLAVQIAALLAAADLADTCEIDAAAGARRRSGVTTNRHRARVSGSATLSSYPGSRTR